MAKLTLKSERMIQADLLTKIISLLGINDVNPGSVIDVLTQAVAQEDFGQYVQMSQIVRLVDLEAITGTDLDNKAFEYGIERKQPQKSNGKIDILRANSFEKISTTFYAGSAAPIIGNTTIDVNDASSTLVGTSGTLILGRGTINEEEITYSAAPVDNTNYWTFTVSPLTNNHTTEETVILKQGVDELIAAGTIISVPATSISNEIQFTVDNDTTLLAGEDKVENVNITAVEPGTAGNISIGQITGESAFPTPPFNGARAENTSKFTTGTNRETDDQLRDRIKNHIQSLSRGTREAILNAISGLADPETAKRVVSANIQLPQSSDQPVKIYIDDGTGFEPSFQSQGFETIIESAEGGEKRLQLDQDALVKAQLETNSEEQYDFSLVPLTLTYTVGNESETITFVNSDFSFAGSATAEEITTAINDRSSLIEARTSQVGKKVVIMAKEDTNENIQVIGGTANSILNFPLDERSSIYLYLDDELKSKDGKTAFIDSQNTSPFDLQAIGGFPLTLNVTVDNKTANPQVVTFQSSDFVNTSACTTDEIVAVVNAQLSGATAISFNNNANVRIISNTLTSSNSAIQVTGGTVNDPTFGLNFSTSIVQGLNSDYILNRELGTIELNTPLLENQQVTVGTLYTRGKLRATSAENYNPLNGQTLVISVDGGANQTITFDTSFSGGQSAEYTANFINSQLNGATASVRIIGNNNYLEITTNTYEEALGSIEIKSASTSNSVFGFEVDSVISNQRPHKAFKTSVAAPFNFAQGDSLVLVINNDIVNNTYNVVMDYDGLITSATSTTQFANSVFFNVFPNDDDLNDYYCAFVSGSNITTGEFDIISDQGGNTWRYEFTSLPTNLANFAAGDIINIVDSQNVENNGDFLITSVSTAGNGYIEISNTEGIIESGSAGTVTIGQRRQITDYVGATGAITVGSAFSNTPINGDAFIVLPSTVDNITSYINNTKITSLSLKATIDGVENNTKIQIASSSEGSDGYVQITGGKAQDLMQFNTDLIRGLEAYNYYIGLTKLVHDTIYGDDADLTTFPGVGAAGVQFQILAPTVTNVSVELSLTLSEGVSIDSVENEVKSAVTNYINNLGIGDDVVLEEIRATVIAIGGIRDVILNQPTDNISISDNEIARIRSNEIVIG